MNEKYVDNFLIGFMSAIVCWSIVYNTFGLALLFPIYFIYHLVQKSKKDKNK